MTENAKASLPKNLDSIVLIDDDVLVHETWKMVSDYKDISLYCFYDIDSFLKDSLFFHKSTPIYIDSNLSNGIKGEIEAEKIFELGFDNLFLTSGDQEIKLPIWIKNHFDKTFPIDQIIFHEGQR